jgi:hypothetical protein
MAKENTLKELGEMLEHVVKNMATKDDVEELRQEVKNGFTGVNSKIDGVHNRIDEELDKRKQLEVRVSRLEEKVG